MIFLSEILVTTLGLGVVFRASFFLAAALASRLALGAFFLAVFDAARLTRGLLFGFTVFALRIGAFPPFQAAFLTGFFTAGLRVVARDDVFLTGDLDLLDYFDLD